MAKTSRLGDEVVPKPLAPRPPRFFCVPSALIALTGADYLSVIFPALNRAAKHDGLLDAVGSVYRLDTLRALDELGYACRPARDRTPRQVRTWAKVAAARGVRVATAALRSPPRRRGAPRSGVRQPRPARAGRRRPPLRAVDRRGRVPCAKVAPISAFTVYFDHAGA